VILFVSRNDNYKSNGHDTYNDKREPKEEIGVKRKIQIPKRKKQWHEGEAIKKEKGE